MRILFLMAIVILSGCAQKQYHGAARAEHMSNLYLCKDFEGETSREVKDAEIEKRGLNCSSIIEQYETGKAALEKNTTKQNVAKNQPEVIRAGSPLKLGMSQRDVITALGMRGYPASRHKNITTHGTYEHWELCRDWLNGWNTSTVTCSGITTYRMMFVDGKLESFSG